MKFASKKDWLFNLIALSITVLLIASFVLGILIEEMPPEKYWIIALIIATIGIISWIYFGTNYEITDDEFIYRSGPIRGRMKVSRITEIVKGKTLWVGFRPATARNGLIIKYDKYDELYISPINNEDFIKRIQQLNDQIIISE